MRKKKGAQEISNEVLCAEYEAVYHYALSICRNETEAQDLTQETFLKAMNAVESFKGNSSLYTWLCAIAKNLWINRCKKQSREIIPENIAEMGQDDQPSIEQQVADKETAMHIHKILHNMNEPYKEVFHYGYSVNFLFPRLQSSFPKRKAGQE